MNKIIIDGYNVIHRVPNLSRFLDVSLERAREELIFQLKSYLVNHKVSIVLVFDGAHPSIGLESRNPNGSFEVLFSKIPFKADPVIKNLINKEEKKKSLTIVTDDTDIIRYAKSQKVNFLSSTAFYDRLEKRFIRKELTNKYDQEMSEEELSEWLQIFGEK
jgi:predicted RNA-binding protein with PIN domain